MLTERATPTPRGRRIDFTPAPLELRRRGPSAPDPAGWRARFGRREVRLGAALLFVIAVALAGVMLGTRASPAGVAGAPAGALDRAVASWVTGARTAWERHVAQGRAADELRALRLEHDRLQTEVLGLRALADEHERVVGLLGMAERERLDGVVGRVVRRPTVGRRVLRIDVGAASGVAPGLAVVGPAGLVGQVLSRDAGFADVLSITDPSHRLPVDLGGSFGTARGDGEGLVVEHVVATATVAVGAVVRSSGEGGVFPPGLPVGVVTAVRSGAGPFLEVDVRAAAPPSLLSEVLVVQSVRPVPPPEVPLEVVAGGVAEATP